MINRERFFSLAKEGLFKQYSQSQVSGLNLVLDTWDSAGLKDLRWLAYMLATVYHETAGTIQPIKEYGGIKYLRSKKYWPYYGRGYVQLTWEQNYRLMSKLWNAGHEEQIDLVKTPDRAQEPRIAVFILFEGMTNGYSGDGDFTGKSLEDYFNNKVTDFVGARHIINGTDKAEKIAGYARVLYDALRTASGER